MFGRGGVSAGAAGAGGHAFCLGAGLPKDRHAVGVELAIVHHQCHAFGLGLGEKQAVERVAVMKRQREQGGAMGRGDGQQTKAIRFKLAGKDVRLGCGECELSQGRLDGHFPEAGGADVRLVGGSLNGTARPGAELGVIGEEPEQRVGVKQQSYSA